MGRRLRSVPAFDLCLSAVSAALSLIVAAGLARRGRVGACSAFLGYLLVGVIARILRWTWPALYTWQFDVVTDLLQVGLGGVVAVELAQRAFVALPGGRVRAERLQVLVAVGAGLALLAPWPALDGLPWTYVYGRELVQRLAYARAWLFASGLAVAAFHGVPLDRIHREIAGGFVVWSLVMGLNSHLAPIDGVLQLCRQVVASLIYPGVLAAWAVMAWAPDERTALTPVLLRTLRPWRSA